MPLLSCDENKLSQKMKTVFTFTMMLIISASFAQTKQFTSKSATYWKPTRETKEKVRVIVISVGTITIPKFANGGTEDITLKIERMEQKNYRLELSTWYYCTELREDISIDDSDNIIHRKAIVIVPESAESEFPNSFIHYYSFASEVDVYHYSFGIY